MFSKPFTPSYYHIRPVGVNQFNDIYVCPVLTPKEFDVTGQKYKKQCQKPNRTCFSFLPLR